MEQDLTPAFAALAHPQRLAVIRLLLSRHPTPIPAGDIGLSIGIKPSTLSGYLAQLVEARLITQERRGTSLLYAASLEGIEGLNSGWIGTICRGRGLPDLGPPGPRIRNLLFLGRKNAGPTLIAEAILRKKAGEWYEVFSAGVEAIEIPDPNVMGLLAARSFDTDLLWSKSVESLLESGAPRIDLIITLGDTASLGMPAFFGCPLHAHWNLPRGLDAERLFDALAERIDAFASLDPSITARGALQAALDGAELTVA